MKRLFTFLFVVSVLSATVWAADVSVKETFSRAPKGALSACQNKDWQGDVCVWHATGVRRNTGDTIHTATTKQAEWIPMNSTSEGKQDGQKIYTLNWEGGIKAVTFKYARFGSEYKKDQTTGRSLRLRVIAGDMEPDSTAKYDNNTMKLGNGDAANHESYSHSFNCKSANAQLTIENISTFTETNPTGICRILVSDIEITPYLLYRQKDVTIGVKQQGYYNAELINNTGKEGSISYSSSATGVATVDEYGVITPVSAGDAVITATWSKGVTTTYTLHVVNNIIAENFSKVKQTSQTASAEWDGDLFTWEVANVRRGADDTLGLNPRIQATALRSNAGSSLISAEKIEGGIKHIAFDWRQWASGTTPLTINMYYSASKDSWGDAVATQSEDAVGAATPHSFSEDIDDGAKGNAYLKLNYTSGAGVAVLGAIKITPWLLYTTKEATLDTRNTLTYTNTGLINNTTGDAPTYEITPANAAVSISSTGQVAVEDGASVNGDFTVTASWSEVTTTYTLHITSRTNTTASYANSVVRLGLGDAVPANALTKTDGYDGTITYSSSNTAVATVASNGTVSLAGGVGQATITATLPATANFTAAEASYNLFVRDNGSRIEMFSNVSQSGIVGETLTDWNGDLFTWQAQYQVRRGTNDTIHAGISKHQGTSIGIQNPTGTPISSILQSKDDVEGGIKYLTFYWMQWGAASDGTRRIAVYADDDLIGYQENPRGTSGKTGDEFMLGINNAMKSNKKLVIKNESYKGSVGTLSDATNCSRIVLDNIYITPYLRYTTKERTLDLRTATSCTYTPDVDNTENGTITYSLEDNDGEATIDASSGTVTGIKAGEVTVKATWSEGAFVTYTLNIISITETEASYPNAEIHATMGEAIPANALAYTDGYDGEISYASSVPAVADFVNGVLTLKAPGQTKITATLPETSNYAAATASYILTVSYTNYESFNLNTTGSTYAKPEENAQGDKCNWYAYIGGIQTPNYFSSNAITMRAQRTNETKQGYVKSAILSGGISALSFNYSMMFTDDNIDKWDIRVYVNDRLVGQLTNEAGGDLEGINGRTLNPMRTKVITGINEPGKFVIRFENHSTIKEGVTYTEGNMGRFAIDNVSWEGYNGTKSLAENEDNNGWIRSNGGETCNVTITRSAMFANVYNTICLPFAISKADDLDDADVQEMTSASIDGDVLTIGFSALDGDELQAGKPYLVKPTSNKDISGTYSSKQISSIASPVTFGSVTLQGIYSPTPLKANDYSTLFVGVPDDEGNNLFYPSEDASLNGFRAYFKINEAMGAPIRHARFVTDQTNTATGSEEVRSETVGIVRSEKILENGQLVIIRDGVRYDVLGRKK